MPSTTKRVGIVVLAVAALVAAFAVLRPGEPNDAPPGDNTTPPAPTSTPAAAAAARSSPHDRGPVLRAGALRTIRVR